MLTKENGVFIWRGRYEDREKPKDAGFDWNITRKRWETFDRFTAARLNEPHPELDTIPKKVTRSNNAIPESANLDGLYPYQKAGVEFMADEFRAGRRAMILADEPGLGKSAQACRLADELGWGALLVVCPASLRLNWCRELQMWRRKGPDAIAVLDGKKFPQPGKTVVISYNLLIGKHWKDRMSFQ